MIQFCAKYGGPEERKAIVEEIRANIVDMSKSKYGRHLVKKLIAVATKEEVPGALNAVSWAAGPVVGHAFTRDSSCNNTHTHMHPCTNA